MKDFIEGAGSIINLFPSRDDANFFLPTHSDEDAILSDWQKIGDDLILAAEKTSVTEKQTSSKKK